MKERYFSDLGPFKTKSAKYPSELVKNKNLLYLEFQDCSTFCIDNDLLSNNIKAFNSLKLRSG